MRKSILIIVATSFFFAGCSGTKFEKALFTTKEKVEVVETSDGEFMTVTNSVVVPRYADQIQTTENIASALHPMAGWAVSVFGGILGLVARSKTRRRQQQDAHKQLVLTKAIQLHGAEAIALISELTNENTAPEKLKGKFRAIQDKLGIWNDVNEFLDPASEIEVLLRDKLGKK